MEPSRVSRSLNAQACDEPGCNRDYRFKNNGLLLLAFGSLGVVYGDVGTSPLYAFASIFSKEPTKHDVLGAASLTFWMLTIILMVKYVVIVLRADDHGEGGTFALYSLLCRSIGVTPLGYKEPAADRSLVAYSYHSNQQASPAGSRTRGPTASSMNPASVGAARKLNTAFGNKVWLQKLLLVAALAATAMVLGDGVFTPAISVLSAVSGLTTLVPSISNDTIVAVTVAILVVLFSVQRLGTHKVSLAFGPVVLLWFLALSAISFYRFATHGVAALAAVNPWHVVRFFQMRGVAGWHAMADAVLVVTGTEALFADLGHFSRASITLSASVVAYPALAITYLSQAAFLMDNPTRYPTLFWDWVPGPIQWPMLILATAATIIASQALISASFSLVSQAMKLGLFPTMTVVHTGPEHVGQIYIAEINYILMGACVLVVGGFRDTVALGHAYGLSVVTVMAITTLLLMLVMVMVWGWPLLATAAVCLPFLAIELAILTASFPKISEGAWVALVIAAVSIMVMLIWWYVQRLKLSSTLKDGAPPRLSLTSLLALKPAAAWPPGPKADATGYRRTAEHYSQLGKEAELDLVHVPTGRILARTAGIGVYYAATENEAPKLLEHLLRMIPALPEVMVLLTVRHAPVSNVTDAERFLVYPLEGIPNSYQVEARYGYMDHPCHDEAFMCCMLQFMATQIRQRWLAKRGTSSDALPPFPEESDRAHTLQASTPATSHLEVVIDPAGTEGVDATVSAGQVSFQAAMLQLVDVHNTEGNNKSKQQQSDPVIDPASGQASGAMSLELGKNQLAAMSQQGGPTLEGAADMTAAALMVQEKAASSKAAAGSSGGTLLQTSCSPEELLLDYASKQVLMQAVAHEVVQSRPGSGMVKQLIVDGIYPLLSLGSRRAAQAMQLPPSSTLEVVMAVQV